VSCYEKPKTQAEFEVWEGRCISGAVGMYPVVKSDSGVFGRNELVCGWRVKFNGKQQQEVYGLGDSGI